MSWLWNEHVFWNDLFDLGNDFFRCWSLSLMNIDKRRFVLGTKTFQCVIRHLVHLSLLDSDVLSAVTFNEILLRNAFVFMRERGLKQSRFLYNRVFTSSIVSSFKGRRFRLRIFTGIRWSSNLVAWVRKKHYPFKASNASKPEKQNSLKKK